MKQGRPIKGLVAFVVGVTLAVIVAITSLNSSDDSARTSVATKPPAIAAPVRQDRILQMERRGELHTMLQQHQAMMQQMQASASPQMLEIMRNDPMWQMLESGELVKDMEEHQADINRMLAQPGQ